MLRSAAAFQKDDAAAGPVQEAQLSQRGREREHMLHVIEYYANSLKVTRNKNAYRNVTRNVNAYSISL